MCVKKLGLYLLTFSVWSTEFLGGHSFLAGHCILIIGSNFPENYYIIGTSFKGRYIIIIVAFLILNEKKHAHEANNFNDFIWYFFNNNNSSN